MKTYKLESTLYNPQEKSKKDLICDFVIRNNEFNAIFDEINNSDFELPKQHYLIIGHRGMGKTTLMMRLKYAVEDNENLKNIIPIILKEEHYAIHKLSDLWIQIAEQLEDYYSFNAVVKLMEKVPYHDEYANDIYKILEQKLQDKNKQLVLFVDNFNDLLEKFSQQEVYVLRDILMNKPYIRLVASNSTLVSNVSDYQKPLYEFFKQFKLKALKQKEVIALLRTLAERHQAEDRIENIIKKSPERINTLRILSGGVPRTVTMLFNIFVKEQTQSTIQDLYKLLDEITPLYKHRMDNLKPNQQKIVYEVAMHWDGISVKELAEKTKMESKTVSAQLNLLSKNQIIDKVKTETKNNFYLLQERFFNIWYLMRLGNKRQHDRVVWLVRFLDNWCCNENKMQRRVDLYLNDQKNFLKFKDILNKKHFSKIYNKINKENLYNEFQMILSVKIEKLLYEEKYFIANQFIEEMELKEVIKPYYYATQYFLGNTQEIKRMGAELQEPFNEIINNISSKK